MTTTRQRSTQAAEHSHHQNNLDTLARACPEWLLKADLATRQSYSRSLSKAHKVGRAARQIMEKIVPLDGFAKKLLIAKLIERFHVDVDVVRAELDHYIWHFSPQIGSPSDKQWVPRLRSQGSLLQMALQNFTAAEADPLAAAPGSRVYLGQVDIEAISPAGFAALCREVDIGRHYQEHLATVLAPGQPASDWEGGVSSSVLQTLAAAKAGNLELAAQVAFMQGRISWPAYQMLLAVSNGDEVLRYDLQPMECCQLVLHGHVLEGVLVFRQAQPLYSFQLPRKRLLYVPDGAAGELREFDDLPDMTTQLALQLKYSSFRQALVRHAALVEQAALEGKLDMGIESHVRERLFSGALFEHLVRQQCQQRRQDSLTLAVPTAQIDLQQREQLVATLEELGLQMLNLVSLFVPVLNAAMLAYTAYDLMAEVYHGIEDWTEDRKDEAMAHLVGVVETLAVGAVLGVAGHKVGKWVQNHDFFQSLRPISMFDGTTRLWSPELEPYRQPVEVDASAVNEQGRVQVRGKEYILMDGRPHHVERHFSSGQWRVRHPVRESAWAPVLEHNGEGAWRHQLENPWDWPSATYAFRRLGPVAQGISDEGAAQVLRWTGLDEAQLCQIHVDNAPVPALLRQACTHWRLDSDISRFVSGLKSLTITDNAIAIFLLPHVPGWDPSLTSVVEASWRSPLLTVLGDALGRERLKALGIVGPWQDATSQGKICELLTTQAQARRAQLFDFCQMRGEPAARESGLLRRDFPGLPVRLAEEVLSQSTAEEVARMHRQGRVPLAIAERARWGLSRYQMLCVREGFEWPWRRDRRFDQLAFGLLEHLPGWPAGTRIELRSRSTGAALLAATGTSDEGFTKVLIKDAEGRFTLNGQNDPESDLFNALNPLLPAAVRRADGQSLASVLADLADADLDRARHLSGQAPTVGGFRPPLLLSDGRIGYPLSGRGAGGEHWQYFREHAKQLFPRLTDAELTTYLEGLSESGVDIARLLREKTEELASLRQSLDRWVYEFAAAESSGAQRRRQRVADEFVSAWRRQSPRVFGDTGHLRGYRLQLDGADLSTPPVFPMDVDFSHVQHLSLSDTGLSSIPNGFLDAFSKLRVLDLQRNKLAELPAIIKDMTRLEELRCADNDIQLTEQSVGWFGNLRRLEVLDLSNNPLGIPPDLSGVVGIRNLQLRFTGISRFPEGYCELTRLELADLRDNQLSELPVRLYQSVLRPARALYVLDNPLSASTRLDIEAYRQRTGINLGGLSEENEPGPQLFWIHGTDEELVRQREIKWYALRAEARSQEFFRILAELSMTAEYEMPRTELFDRVWRMIDAASADSALRQKLFKLAGHPRTCGNSVALNFSYLEIQVEVFRALAPGEGEQVTARLLRLARGLFRLDELDKVVLDDIKVRRQRPSGLGREVEEVEVSLGYRVGLAQALDLPGQPSAMLFPGLEVVSAEQIEAARLHIRAVETPAALVEYLCVQDFWCDWLRKRDAQAFVELRQSLEEEEQQLEERRSSISDGDYYAQYSQLYKVYQDKTASLIRHLSDVAVRRALAEGARQER